MRRLLVVAEGESAGRTIVARRPPHGVGVARHEHGPVPVHVAV
jgi:hypothetical protein